VTVLLLTATEGCSTNPASLDVVVYGVTEAVVGNPLKLKVCEVALLFEFKATML
jgi:hypothetical protein